MFSTTTPADTPARAEEEIHQHIVLMSNLRVKRNSFSPVFRLPPETLATIFIHGARDYYESDNGRYFTSRIPTWVNVSYVCSHWRNIALNHPILWTYHFTTSLRWSEELLLRSKQASLKIRIYPYRQYKQLSWWPSLLNKLLEHSERLQELCLDVPLSFPPATLSLCAPRLEKLEMSFRAAISIPMQPIVITDGDKIPLHMLKLVNCSLPWSSLNLAGLNILSLRHVHSPSPVNMVEFLAILSRMQNLTVLYLEDVLPSARTFLSSDGLNVSPKITLPRLAFLAVIAPVSTVVALLSSVSILPRTQLKLEPLFELGSSVGDFAPISSFLAQQFSQQSSGLTFRSLAFDFGYIGSMTFGLDCDPPSPDAEVDHNVPLKIALGEVQHGDMEEIEPTDSDAHRIISHICCSLPLRNVQSLHIRWPVSSSDFWRETLGCLDGLRYMKLSNGVMHDLALLSLLPLSAPSSNENPGGQPIRDQDHIFVPALEELELANITFTPNHTSPQGRVSRKSLFDILSTRTALQDRVIMTKCNFMDDSSS